MSTQVSREQGRRRAFSFEQLAEAATDFASRGVFFAACLLLVVLWVPSYLVFRNVDTWQLVINTATTIVTFLLVALLQNSARRSDRAIHDKLNAMADGLADLMEHQLSGDSGDLECDVEDLKRAVGLERRLGAHRKPPAPLRER